MSDAPHSKETGRRPEAHKGAEHKRILIDSVRGYENVADDREPASGRVAGLPGVFWVLEHVWAASGPKLPGARCPDWSRAGPGRADPDQDNWPHCMDALRINLAGNFLMIYWEWA